MASPFLYIAQGCLPRYCRTNRTNLSTREYAWADRGYFQRVRDVFSILQMYRSICFAGNSPPVSSYCSAKFVLRGLPVQSPGATPSVNSNTRGYAWLDQDFFQSVNTRGNIFFDLKHHTIKSPWLHRDVQLHHHTSEFSLDIHK